MIGGISACEAHASLNEDGSRIDGRPEVVLEGGLRSAAETGCKILDLAINREMKLGRGGGPSSSSFPIGTESAGIYRVSSVSARLTHDLKDLLSHV